MLNQAVLDREYWTEFLLFIRDKFANAVVNGIRMPISN